MVDKNIILKHSEIKWRMHSTDKISEVISHLVSVQSKSVALEGSCQYMVYRSVNLFNDIHLINILLGRTSIIEKHCSSPAKSPVVYLSKKPYSHCLVLVGSRNGFERD